MSVAVRHVRFPRTSGRSPTTISSFLVCRPSKTAMWLIIASSTARTFSGSRELTLAGA